MLTAAQTACEGEARAAGGENDDQRLEEEHGEDAARGGAERFAQPDFAGALADGHQHDIHRADAAQQQRDHAHRAEEVLHAVGHGFKGPGLFERVPDVGGVLVGGVEAVQAREGAADLAETGLMHGERAGLDDQLIDGLGRQRRRLGQVADHGRERDEDLVDIAAVIAGVLLLVLHHANDLVGPAVDGNLLAQRFTRREQLFPRLGAEESDAARLALVLPGEETALGGGQVAKPLIGRLRSADQQRGSIVAAAHRDGAAREFRKDELAGGAIRGDEFVVVDGPAHGPAGARAARLHGSAARENQQQVLPELHLHAALAFPEAVAGGGHQSDGDHAPGEAEHREPRAQLVRAERLNGVAEQVAKCHAEPAAPRGAIEE